MCKLKYGPGVTVFLSIVLLLEKGHCQSPQSNQLNRASGGQTQQNGWFFNGPRRNAGNGGGMPSWMQMADQFMSGWMNNLPARQVPANNGTTQQGGFFSSLGDRIVNFRNEMAARRQNSTRSISPRFQTIQNRTRNWFNNWMNF